MSKHRVIARSFAHAREFAHSQGWKPLDWAYVWNADRLHGLERGTTIFVVVGASAHPQFVQMMEIAEARQYVLDRRAMR